MRFGARLWTLTKILPCCQTFCRLCDDWEHAKTRIETLTARTKKLLEGYKDASFAAFALKIQKMQLEAYGADKVLPMQNRSLRKKLMQTATERDELRARLSDER